jgi:glycosyltransferase involved in cell wall biosynthesis
MSSGKKLMFVLPRTTEFGGLEKHLLELLRRLPAPNPYPSIVCFGQDTITARMDRDQQKRVAVKCQKEPESFTDWFRMIREARPDIIVFCYNWIEAFPWQAPVAALLAGVNRRFTIQHLIPSLVPPPVLGKSLFSMVRRLIGRRARYFLRGRIAAYASNTTICVSDAVRKVLVNDFKIPPRKAITIRNGVSTSSFVPSKMAGAAVRCRLEMGPEDFLLVCIARLAEAKGIDILLEAVSHVVLKGTSCKCIIVGDGPLKEKLSQQALSLGLSGYVFFEGFQEDVRPYLQAGSSFILTSHLEGLPFSVLEAMSCGLPCIVTNVGGNAEIVDHQVTGLVIPPASVDAAADAISYLATHPRELAQMASRTRETVCRTSDLDRQMQEVIHAILS